MGIDPKRVCYRQQEVAMSGTKRVEFGKDLGLMLQVVKSGLCVSIGYWEFWGPFSRQHQLGLWTEALHFLKERGNLIDPWLKSTSLRHIGEPNLDTLDKVVREGRRHRFEKPEWTLLAEDPGIFEGLVDYLAVIAPFTVDVEVDYDREPPYSTGNGGAELFGPPSRSGKQRHLMSIYVHSGGDSVKLPDLDARLKEEGWRFAEQHELYAFGQATRQKIRPWALHRSNNIEAFGNIVDTSAPDFIRHPKLWRERGAEWFALDASGFIPGGGVADDEHLLIVKS